MTNHKEEPNLPLATASSGPTFRRRSSRLPLAIPILLYINEQGGETAVVKAFTLTVSKHGAEIASPVDLVTGLELSIENPGAKCSAKAKVVWTRGRRKPDSPFEAAVEIAETDNVWGLKFPPEDWQREGAAEALDPASKVAAAKESAGRMPIEHQSTMAISGCSERSRAAALAKGLAPAVDGIQPQVSRASSIRSVSPPGISKSEIFGATPEGPKQETSPAQSPVEQAAQVRAVHESASPEPLNPPTPDQDSILKPRLESESASSKTQAAAAEGLRKEDETRNADIEQLAADFHARLAEISASLQEAFRGSLATGLEKERTAVRQAAKDLTGSCLREMKEQVQKLSEEAVESAAGYLRRQAEDALLLATEELRDSCTALIKEAQLQIASGSRALVDSVQAEIEKRGQELRDQMVARTRADVEQAAKEVLESLQKQIDTSRMSLNAWLDQAGTQFASFETRMNEASCALLDASRHETEIALASVRERLRQALRLLDQADEKAPSEPK